MKFDWNTITSICLPTVYGRFHSTTAKFSSCGRDHMVLNAYIYYLILWKNMIANLWPRWLNITLERHLYFPPPIIQKTETSLKLRTLKMIKHFYLQRARRLKYRHSLGIIIDRELKAYKHLYMASVSRYPEF